MAQMNPADAAQGLAAGGLGGGTYVILGTLIGNALAAGNFEEAKRLQARAMAELQGLDPQSLARVRAEVGESAFRNLTEPPEGRAAQLRALQRLEAMGTGESPEDAAAYARAAQEAAAQERGVRMAAMQRLAQRGVGATSGLALAAQQEAAQQATQLAATRGLETAAESRRRALQALQAGAGLAGELRGADYRAASERARAQDIINQFNAQQRMRQAESLYGAQEAKARSMAGAYKTQAEREEEEAARKIATFAAGGKAVGTQLDTATKMLAGGV
jgi:hypothetical protein